MSSERQNVTVDQEFTVNKNNGVSTTNEKTVNAQTLERCLTDRIDREMGNTIDTVEEKIQKSILTAIDNIISLKMELAVGSIKASSGRNAASVTANSERGEHTGIAAFFENVSDWNNTFHEINVNDETWETSLTRQVNYRSREHILTGNHTLITI